jgi:hypothetical protein
MYVDRYVRFGAESRLSNDIFTDRIASDQIFLQEILCKGLSIF